MQAIRQLFFKPKRCHPPAVDVDQPMPLLDSRRFGEICATLLQNGHTVRFRAGGHSMWPAIRPNEVIWVHPVKPDDVNKGDIVLYRQAEHIIVHRIVRVSGKAGGDFPSGRSCSSAGADPLFFLRGDAAPVGDGPVQSRQILGKVVAVERRGRRIDPYSLKHNLACRARLAAARLRKILKSA